MDDFSKPKIVYQELCRKGTAFALDFDGYFLGNTGYILSAPFLSNEDLSVLCDMLNSAIALYQLDKISTKFDETGWRWLRQFVDEIKLPPIIHSSSNWLRHFGFSDKELSFIFEKYTHVLPD